MEVSAGQHHGDEPLSPMLNDHGTTDRQRLASGTDTLSGNGHDCHLT